MKASTVLRVKRWLPPLLLLFIGLFIAYDLMTPTVRPTTNFMATRLPQTLPLPTVAEVLANPATKPVGLTIAWYESLCARVRYSYLLATDGVDFNLTRNADLQSAYFQMDTHIKETATWVIDGRTDFQFSFQSLLILPPMEVDICADVSSLAPGRYVSQFSFETPPGNIYSHTWVFERTADGVIPEVTSA